MDEIYNDNAIDQKETDFWKAARLRAALPC